MTDLDKLIDAVEGGNVCPSTKCLPKGCGQYVQHAAKGSLDAAKLLHEALLPELLWGISPLGKARIIDKSFNTITEGEYTGSESRSWLIAILKAYRHSKNAHSSVHQRTP